MAEAVFDQVARFAARLDPPGFLGWAVGLPADEVGFRGWLDTRGVPFPGDPERTGDTVARLDDPATGGTPWAVAVEFQAAPDPQMFGRLLVYLGHLWQAAKPDAERGSRFHLGAVVVNLTGTGLASRRMEWLAAGFLTHIRVVERNLAGENADDLLGRIEAGAVSRALLQWVPLMAGGGRGAVIGRWKRLAADEPDARARSDYAGLARVFAGKAKRQAAWDKALEGWNVTESKVVNEWIKQGIVKGRAVGRAEGRAEGVIAVLKARFKPVPAALTAAVQAETDLDRLRSWLTAAATAPTLDDFRETAGV